MNVFVPNNLNVKEIAIPPSKSFAQRALLGQLLSAQPVEVLNIGKSNDVQAIESIVQQLPQTSNLNCGESGLGIRLTVPIAATFGKKYKITGSGSLLKRPMDQFESFLPALGTNCKTNYGFLPIEIEGALKGGEIEIDGTLSSQFLSGLLMALPKADQGSILKVKNLNSRPYIDITLEVLRFFQIKIENDNYEVFTIPGNQHYIPLNNRYVVEGDWSAAAFWIVYGAIHQNIRIQHINKNSCQADKAILTCLNLAGIDFHWDQEDLVVNKGEVKPFEFDATDCPDLFPILTVLAAAAHGESIIKGANRLTHKESDRATVLIKEFSQLGLDIKKDDDLLIINGNGSLNNGTIDSNNDHRIAMAGAIAATLTEKGLMIQDAKAVNKSYPEFWNEI